jgi:lambda repressor-like predicted transcriptional regulator
MERVAVVFNAHAASKSLRWRALVDWHRGITTAGVNKRGWEHSLTRRYSKHSTTLKREREELLLAIADEIIYPRVTEC